MGLYELPRRTGEAHLYRLNHPLAESLVSRAKGRELPTAEIRFDYGQHDGKITPLEPLIGKSGWLTLTLFSVESLEQAEDHLIFAATTDDGQTLDDEVAARLLTLPGTSSPLRLLPPLPQGEGWGEGGFKEALDTHTQQRQAVIQRDISERNARFFEAEADKLDGWADDLKLGLEREIKELDRQIKEARRAATTAVTLEEKLAGQKQVKSLEAQRNLKRRSLFDAQDQVDVQREELIAAIEGKLSQNTWAENLFLIRWAIS
jgi:adenine-specific DNA-methyltransferase